jgi:hypothetical protein
VFRPEFAGLVDGVVLALVLVVVVHLLARVVPTVVVRALLAAVLVIAAGVHIAFAVAAGAGAAWTLAEIAGVAVYGTLAALGVRGSYWWLVAGWAAHPVWDVALHDVGPGHAFALDTYTIPCLSFDLLVAVYIALVGPRWPRPDVRTSRRRRWAAIRTGASVQP